MTEERGDHEHYERNQEGPPQLDRGGQAADFGGGAGDGANGERGVPTAPAGGSAVLPVGETSSPGRSGGAASAAARSPRRARRGQVGAGSGAAADAVAELTLESLELKKGPWR